MRTNRAPMRANVNRAPVRAPVRPAVRAVSRMPARAGMNRVGAAMQKPMTRAGFLRGMGAAAGVAAAGLLGSGVAHATGTEMELHVGHSQTYLFVQDAIAAAADGATIYVHPGEWTEGDESHIGDLVKKTFPDGVESNYYYKGVWHIDKNLTIQAADPNNKPLIHIKEASASGIIQYTSPKSVTIDAPGKSVVLKDLNLDITSQMCNFNTNYFEVSGCKISAPYIPGGVPIRIREEFYTRDEPEGLQPDYWFRLPHTGEIIVKDCVLEGYKGFVMIGYTHNELSVELDGNTMTTQFDRTAINLNIGGWYVPSGIEITIGESGSTSFSTLDHKVTIKNNTSNGGIPFILGGWAGATYVGHNEFTADDSFLIYLGYDNEAKEKLFLSLVGVGMWMDIEQGADVLIHQNTVNMLYPGDDSPALGSAAIVLSLFGNAYNAVLKGNKITGAGNYGVFLGLAPFFGGLVQNNIIQGTNVRGYNASDAMYMFGVNSSGNIVRGSTGGGSVVDLGEDNWVSGWSAKQGQRNPQAEKALEQAACAMNGGTWDPDTQTCQLGF